MGVSNLKKERLKIGVIGLGKMGLLHCSILSTLPEVELAALCEKSNVIRRLCKRIFREAEVVGDSSELSKSDLDAVYITTPIPTHFALIRNVLLEDIAPHVFTEKTLASTHNESLALCELSKDSTLCNMVGYMKRFAVTFVKARKLLEEKTIGEVKSFDAYAYSSDFYGVRKNPEASASRGNVLRDLGAHSIDLALWYFGDLHVDPPMPESLDKAKSEDAIHFSARTSDGLKGRFDISWCRAEYRMPESGLNIHGSRGSIKVTDDEVSVELHDGASDKWYRANLDDNVPFLSGAPEYFREDQHFVKSVLMKSKCQPDFATASKVDKVVDEVYATRVNR